MRNGEYERLKKATIKDFLLDVVDRLALYSQLVEYKPQFISEREKIKGVLDDCKEKIRDTPDYRAYNR